MCVCLTCVCYAIRERYTLLTRWRLQRNRARCLALATITTNFYVYKRHPLRTRMRSWNGTGIFRSGSLQNPYAHAPPLPPPSETISYVSGYRIPYGNISPELSWTEKRVSEKSHHETKRCETPIRVVIRMQSIHHKVRSALLPLHQIPIAQNTDKPNATHRQENAIAIQSHRSAATANCATSAAEFD